MTEKREVKVTVSINEDNEIGVTSTLGNATSVAHLLSVGLESVLNGLMQEEVESLEEVVGQLAVMPQDPPDENESK